MQLWPVDNLDYIRNIGNCVELNYKLTPCEHSDSWLFLIHGLFGSADNLAIVKRHFEAKHNIVSIDLPDHGESEWTDGFDIETAAESVKQIADQISVKTFAILGHSLGGKVAMKLALKYPTCVSHLIVADIAPVAYSHRHQTIFDGLNAVDLTSLTTRKDADSAMATVIKEAGVRQFLLKSLYRKENGDWAWKFNLKGLIQSYPKIINWQPVESQFTGTTLFIKGAKSDYIISEYKDDISRYFPNAKAHIIDGVGHWLHAEKPSVFNAVVERVL